MAERLAAGIEAAALVRRVNAEGGFAAILRKGDPDRGALTLILRERGIFHSQLERELGPAFEYEWNARRAADGFGSDLLEDFVARKERFDADFWLIELDIAEPERFIAETTSLG